jgi:AcrR family transcriptional regulator
MAVAAPSVKERLLEVAGRLFYAEGIHAVGVDRVIAEAGVAKATLYAHFRGKDELVAAYLACQSQWWDAAVTQRADGHEPGSAAAALSPFDVLQQRAAAPGYRGCPFINAAAEFPDPGPVAGQVAAHRRQVRATFARLLGITDADAGLLGALIALYDGAMSAAYLDHDPTVVAHARRGAEIILHRGGQA